MIVLFAIVLSPPTARAIPLPPDAAIVLPVTVVCEMVFKDIFATPFITIDSTGMIQIPAGAGMGFSVDRAKLEKYTEREAEFSA